MEATIQTNNQAINIDINVSINVGALKANIQRGLQAIKQRVLQTVNQATKQYANVRTLTLPRLYRKELKAARAIGRVVDAHQTISNIFLWIMCAACFWTVLAYNFTTHI